MLPEPMIRDAMAQFRLSANKVRQGSQEWIQFVSAAGALGWVLEEHGFFENTQAILDELATIHRVSDSGESK